MELTKIRKPPMNRIILKERRPCNRRVNLKTCRGSAGIAKRCIRSTELELHAIVNTKRVRPPNLLLISRHMRLSEHILLLFSVAKCCSKCHETFRKFSKQSHATAAFNILTPALDPPLVKLVRSKASSVQAEITTKTCQENMMAFWV